MKDIYSVKEIFYTLQGEGAQSGRPAIFCRFSKCNLWNGRESDRENSICKFCDTDFVGTDGQNGGKYGEQELITTILSLWPTDAKSNVFLVCTGGEPALQLNQQLLDAFHAAGFEVAIETNGTLPLPRGLDWVCVSPKGSSEVVIQECDELKLAFPQIDNSPEDFTYIKANYRYLTPIAPPKINDVLVPSHESNTRLVIEYCLTNPEWRLNLQTHKVVGLD